MIRASVAAGSLRFCVSPVPLRHFRMGMRREICKASDTTPVSEAFFFFQIRGWSKGCRFLHLLREAHARCFISWRLLLLALFTQRCTLKTAYDSKTSPCPSHYEQVKEAWSSLIAMTTRENNGTLVRLGLKPRDDAPTSMGRG